MANDQTAKRDAKTPPGPDAGFWLRVAAKLIDHAVWAVVHTICVAAGAYLNAIGHPPWVIAAGFVLPELLWYCYIFELTRRRGQTIGKIAASIQVIVSRDQPPPPPVMLKRVLIEAVFDQCGLIFMVVGWIIARAASIPDAAAVLGGIVVGGVIGLINPAWIIISDRKQAIHDRVANTYVVRLAQQPIGKMAALAAMGVLLPLAAVFFLIRPYLVEAYQVPTGSMRPTIKVGDRILANKLFYNLRPPQRYDIAMFRPPETVNPEREIYVKRIVGVPGDRLQIRDGRLYRNGQPAREPYLTEPIRYTWPEHAAENGYIVVPERRIVVLGDNRNNSNDSHAWTRITPDGSDVVPAPFVPIDNLQGKLVFRYWPPGRFGTVAQRELQNR